MAFGAAIVTIAATLTRAVDNMPSASPIERLLALAWGVMVTLCITGYTFGQSNQHVYLLDALRIEQPESLARDWFTNHTLQYHFLYTHLVIGLHKIGLLAAGFFALYLALAIAMHLAWMSIVRHIGGDLKTYMLSVLAYHLSAGGLGLGVYQFLQDGSFLPSNISSIATLVALALWLDRRLIAAGVAVGVAGLFHVNYAILGVGAWGSFSVWCFFRGERARLNRYATATLIAMPPCLFNVILPALEAMKQSAEIPMGEFVALYVRLRHQHHHDPLHWPLALWISFLWPLPLAGFALRKLPSTIATRRLNLALAVTLAMVAFAFVFAGIWFVSGTLVKLSLFRFSIYPKLITCCYAAWLVTNAGERATKTIAAVCGGIALLLLAVIPLRSSFPESIPAPQLGLLIGASVLSAVLAVQMGLKIPRALRVAFILVALPVCIFFAARQQLGVAMPGENDTDMVAISDWVRDHTPRSALFLTPPQDAIFSLEAQRSTVVGFKQVPQLSAEIVEWKRRLCDVLDMDILQLPMPMPKTLRAMGEQYQSLSEAHIRNVAARYDCDYVIAMRRFDGEASPLFVSPAGRYFVYATPRLDNAAVPPTLHSEANTP